MADENLTQTPDLQSATGLSYGGSGSLMDALGSMPTQIPQEAILSLLQGPSQGQRMAQALAGGVAQTQGTANPVSTLINDQQRQQLGIAAMLQRMGDSQRQAMQWGITNERLQREETRREGHTLFQENETKLTRERQAQLDQLGMNEKLLAAAPVGPARDLLAQKRVGMMERFMGMPVPAEVAQGLALKSETPERVKQIASAYVAASQDPELQQAVAGKFGLDPNTAAYYQKMASNDAFLKANGVPTQDELNHSRVQTEIQQQDLITKRLPKELQGDQKFAADVLAMSQQLFPGKDYTKDLTSQDRARIFQAVHDRGVAEEDARARRNNQMAIDKMLMGVDARLAAAQQKPANPTVVAKMLEPYKAGENILRNVDQLRTDLSAVPADALPAGEDWASQKWAKLKRDTIYTNNQGVFNLKQHWNPITVGMDRTFFDEKGVRALAVFQKQLEATDNLPPRKIMEQYLSTLEGLVKDKMGRDLNAHLNTPGTPPEVIEGAKYLTAPYLKGVGPLGPPLQKVRGKFMDLRAGSKTYGKTIEADYIPGVDKIPDGYTEIK